MRVPIPGGRTINIFAIDQDPVVAARMLCDRHVVKMTLESAQILSTVMYEFGGTPPYRPTHPRHPCTLWAGTTRGNWFWLFEHYLALGNEYTHRYGRDHKSMKHARAFFNGPRPDAGALMPFAMAMPAELRDPSDPVFSYRRYYARKFEMIDMRWTRRPMPAFLAMVPA